MGKVVVSMQMTLDGIVEDPHLWSFQYNSEEQQKCKFDELFACSALVLGRVTYEGFASVWPSMAAQAGAYGERMNSLPKYVASTTLTETGWNASLITGDLATEISRLKQKESSDLLIFGSVELIRSLMQQDLIDEYRLMVFPLILGSGKRLFKDGSEKKGLKLVKSQTLSLGVVSLTYQPA